jgi:hypothetical protein
VVLGLTLWRLLGPPGRQVPQKGWAAAAIAVTAVGAIFTALGPARPGWNRIANNGHGSGARTSLSTGSELSLAAFTAQWQATAVTSEASGAHALVFSGPLQGGPGGTLTLTLTGSPQFRGFVVTGGDIMWVPPSGPRFTGSVSAIEEGSTLVASLRASGQPTLFVHVEIGSVFGNTIDGTVTATPGGSAKALPPGLRL